MRADLSRVGINALDDLALRRLGSAATLTPILEALGAPVNSDYFPYVELMAPRSRFLRSEARQFAELSVFPLPLIEMLERKDARWRAEALTPVGSWRYAKVREARELRSALLDQSQADRKTVERAKLLKARTSDCIALGSDDGLAAVHEVALATLAFLDADALRALWLQSEWLPCRKEYGSRFLLMRLELYRAVAARDGAAMVAAARAALESTAGTSEWRRYVLNAGLLGARSIGADAEGQLLWRRYGIDLYADQGLSIELVMLLTMHSTR
jgi:hypothetical protein